MFDSESQMCSYSDGSLRRRAQGYRTETISSIYDLPAGLTLDPLPMPSPANVFYASNVKARSKREDAENITVEVEAKRVSPAVVP